MVKNQSFEFEHYPILYRIADKFSLLGQRKFLILFRWEQNVLLAGAIVSLFPLDDPNYGRQLATLAAFFFAAAIVITVAIKLRKHEEKWYLGRAIAESIKTLSWRFIMNGEPFSPENSPETVSLRFSSILNEIYTETGTSIGLTLEEQHNAFQPTKQMMEMRALPFGSRKELYVESRIKAQLDWYNTKTRYNNRKENQFFYVLILCQAVALLYSLILIKNPLIFNAVPLITAIASGLISWTKVKQFKELAQAYATTAQEISLILHQAYQIAEDHALRIFVSDSESAFSREHTLWLARKDVFNYLSK